MNYYGILTNDEERMEANLEQYSRPEKAGTFNLRLDYRTWGKRMCLFCYFTDEDTGEKILWDRPWITVAYFIPDKRRSSGTYSTATGNLRHIGEVERLLVMIDELKIPLDEMGDMETGDFREYFSE